MHLRYGEVGRERGVGCGLQGRLERDPRRSGCWRARLTQQTTTALGWGFFLPLKLLNGSLYGTSISRERRSRVGGDSGFWFQHVGGKSSTGRRVVFIKAVEGEDGTRGARAAEVEQKVCDSALRGQKSSRVRNKSRIRYAGTYVDENTVTWHP